MQQEDVTNLQEKFGCMQITSCEENKCTSYFSKNIDSSMRDIDNFEGWKRFSIYTFATLNMIMENYIERIGNHPKIEFLKAIELMMNPSGDHRCPFNSIEDLIPYFEEKNEIFAQCMKLSKHNFSKLFYENQPKIITQMDRAVYDFRDCLNNLNNIYETRDEIFSYRLKWLIPMSKGWQKFYEFDYLLKEQDITINIDFIFPSRIRNSYVYVLFSHSNMEDALNSNEYLKMIAALTIGRSKAYRGVGILICKYYASCFHFTNYALRISNKIYFNTLEGMLELYNCIQFMCECRFTMSSVCMIQLDTFKEKENSLKSKVSAPKGIEKKKKRKILQNISNLPSLISNCETSKNLKSDIKYSGNFL